MSSDHPPTHRQWPDPDLQDSSSNSYALSGKIMLASIIILFVVVVFLVILHLYARWYLLRLQINNTRRRINRRHRSGSTRIVFYVDNNPPPDSRGLDANVLKSLPLFVYSPEMSDNVTECAVCLSEFEEGETGRVLPKCKHGFHTECIDMWFFSNSTCPLCRSPVEAVETEMTGTTSFKPVQESESEPGSSTSVSSRVQPGGTTSFKRVDVRIDVPNRNELSAEGEFRLSSPSPGFRSPGSRLLSRIINMSRKSPAVSPSSGDGPSCVVPAAATELDIESAPESSRPASDR